MYKRLFDKNNDNKIRLLTEENQINPRMNAKKKTGIQIKTKNKVDIKTKLHKIRNNRKSIFERKSLFFFLSRLLSYSIYTIQFMNTQIPQPYHRKVIDIL